MNAIRNYDGLYDSGRRTTSVLSYHREVTGTEPVTLDEAKTHCRIDFNDENDYIENTLIPAARRMIEDYCGIALIETTVTVRIDSGGGLFELPYGPYAADFVMEDYNATEVDSDSFYLRGDGFTKLDYYAFGVHQLTYTAGYTDENLPPDLKLAALHQVAWLYERRGDGLAPTAKTIANGHKRMGWLL